MSNKRKNKKQTQLKPINTDKINEIQTQYANDLMTNPEFSLEVDPENKYHLSDSHKKFIQYLVQYKSIATAAELAEIEMDVARQFYVNYYTQLEVRRINRALYHRQFSNKLLDLDDLGGYLSSLLTDENVPLADQLRTKDKLQVVSMLMELNQLKKDSIENPGKLMNQNVETQLRELSTSAILKLLNEANADEPKKSPEIEIEANSVEEKEYLKTLSTDELLEIINKEKTNG